jgi:transmembrane sensor
MFPSTPESKLNPQIYGEACEWLVEFRTGAMGAVTRERFDAWLRKSPEHLRAYLEVSSLWEDVALHDPLRSLSAEAHIARAKAQDNLVSFTAPQSRDAARTFQQPAALGGRSRKPWAFALAASVMVALLAVGFDIDSHRGVYTTGLGEERSLTLADGSVIELNAESRLRVSYQTDTREVELLSGEALFKVVYNPSRPFVVESGAAIIRDLGTVFDVYRKPRGTTVTVVEGQVAVGPATAPLPHPNTPQRSGGASMSSSAAAPRSNRSGQGADIAVSASGSETGHEEILLSAGEQVTVLPKLMLPPIHVDVDAATAWSHRKLVFDSAPLREVVRSFNRYNARPIVIEDPTLEDFRVIGVFSSTDPISLIRFLSAQPGISVIEDAKEVRITREDEKNSTPR